MFNLFKPNFPSLRGAKRRGSGRTCTQFRLDPLVGNPEALESVTLTLSGLHCTSCAVNIDLTLEDLPGVSNSKTNYQKSETKIEFDPSKTNLKQIKSTIDNLGYQTTD